MRQMVNAKVRTATVVDARYVLPALLGVNTLLLVALDRLHAIPSWVKLAAALFLEF